MINKIDIKQYRKLKNIEINLDKGINILSGTNGTCKTSVLHIISNSFQKIKKTNPIFKDSNSIDIINSVNNMMNPKIETLTKGDKEYNDPANGAKGALFSVTYLDGNILEFRRHNSTTKGKSRFSVKPNYKKGAQEKLPEFPVIYLGLSRLYAYGEYNQDEAIKEIKKNLPDKYLDEISSLYESFTGINISYNGQQNMGDIKTRADFSSDSKGIDSNTISAGEDNLLIIITAIVSLKYYFESINSNKEIESILLIDEIDATLHPAYQIKLLNLLETFSCKYKIQVAFTTHSLSLLEEALNKKRNVIYLIDNIDEVSKMEDVDIYKIKMSLKSKLKEDIYRSRCIPVFTEDEEARLFLNCIFEYFERKHGEKFKGISRLFHLVNANISCDTLKNIFEDDFLLRSTMRSICILDGDQNENFSNFIITLPGNKSPEDLIFEHAQYLYENDVDFWNDEVVQGRGYYKVYYRDNIKVDIESINNKIQDLKSRQQKTKGVRREENKKIFRKYDKFFKLVINHWIYSKDNENQMDKFYNDLKIMFKKVSEFHDISAREWQD